MNNLKLSIIIPTLGREKYLLDTVTDLTKQSLEKSEWECLIVYQDELNKKLFDQFIYNGFNIRSFFCNEKNANLARNIGIKNASNEIILLLDDDIRIEMRDFLANHLLNYNGKKYSGVCGQILTPPNQVPYDDLHPKANDKRFGWFYFKPQYTKDFFSRTGGSGNLSFYKDKAMEIGGFDSNFPGGAFREEGDFCFRYTDNFGLFKYDPNCSIIHIGAPSGGARHIKDLELNHTFGEWYFLLTGIKHKTIFKSEIPFYLFSIIKNRVLNKKVRRNPFLFFKYLVINLKAFYKAYTDSKNPKLLNYEN